MEFLGNIIMLCLTFGETAKLSHSGCTILHSHQLCKMVPISLYPTNTCYFVFVFSIVILVGVKWYLVVVLVWIPLMADERFTFLSCKLDHTLKNNIGCYIFVKVFVVDIPRILFPPQHSLSLQSKIIRVKGKNRLELSIQTNG